MDRVNWNSPIDEVRLNSLGGKDIRIISSLAQSKINEGILFTILKLLVPNFVIGADVELCEIERF